MTDLEIKYMAALEKIRELEAENHLLRSAFEGAMHPVISVSNGTMEMKTYTS